MYGEVKTGGILMRLEALETDNYSSGVAATQLGIGAQQRIARLEADILGLS